MAKGFSALSLTDRIVKRSFDLVFSLLGLLLSWWLILIAAFLARIDSGQNGFFIQQRVGLNGRLFKLIKLRTMRPVKGNKTTITAANDNRITRLGAIFRRGKIDELPQLINVLLGQMSFVGPRPDVPGYADRLKNDDRIILSMRPGITGPATLYYRDEESLLASKSNPVKYNNEVIFPHKVRINKQYIREYSFFNDLKYIWQTISG